MQTLPKYILKHLSKEQQEAILDLQGHEPCPGVDIQFKQSLGKGSGDPPLHATIFRPTQKPSHPTPGLLAFHGGGFQSGNPDGCGAIAKVLALTHGITTVSSSYTLASEGKPSYPAILSDALYAYRWMIMKAEELNIDIKRIIVSGESAGVGLAANLAVNNPHIEYTLGEPRPAALIAQWGCLDFVARWFDRNENAGAEGMLFGATYEQNPAIYHQASPVTFAYAQLPPALFIFGKQDPVVHARQGRIGHAAWQAAGALSNLRILSNIGHGVVGDNRAQRAEYLQAAVDFVEFLAEG